MDPERQLSSAAGAAGDQAIYSNGVGGDLTAHSAADGSVLWQYATSTTLYGSDAVSDGHIFFGGFDGNVYAFS